MHSTDKLDDALDAQELVRGLIKRKGIQWVHDFFVGMQQRHKGSLRRACAKLGPAAVATLLQAMTQANGWKDRIHASELLLTYGGHRPADKIEHAGKDGGPIETKTDLSGLSTDELRQLRTLLQKAKRASAE